MAINVKLKFSWGHIIAFLAMIFVSYVSFMGLTYITGGSFVFAGIGVFVINLLLFVFFIVPQFLKGTDVRFNRKIRWERALIYLSVPMFLVSMAPFVHFWAVYQNKTEIEEGFDTAVSKIEELFYSYESYAEARIASYDAVLDSLAIEPISRQNRLEALRLQIVDGNFEALQEGALEWINMAKGVTVWNVFMIGNVDMVSEAIDSWHAGLAAFSEKKLQYEKENVEPFSSENEGVLAAKDQLAALRNQFTTPSFPSWIAYPLIILLYFMMLFPYIIQRRNTKSLYTLWGQRKGVVPDMSSVIDDIPEAPEASKPAAADSKFKPIVY